MKRKFRVIRDNYGGYKVQVRLWWFPFLWIEIGGRDFSVFGSNTFCREESALKYIEDAILYMYCSDRGKVVKYVDANEVLKAKQDLSSKGNDDS